MGPPNQCPGPPILPHTRFETEAPRRNSSGQRPLVAWPVARVPKGHFAHREPWTGPWASLFRGTPLAGSCGCRVQLQPPQQQSTSPRFRGTKTLLPANLRGECRSGEVFGTASAAPMHQNGPGAKFHVGFTLCMSMPSAKQVELAVRPFFASALSASSSSPS